MAQRTGRGTRLLSLSGIWSPLSHAAFAGQAEEGEPIPARTRDFERYGAQGAIRASLVFEAGWQHFHSESFARERPRQNGPGRGNSAIVTVSRTGRGDHSARRADTQIGIVGDPGGTRLGAFG